MAQAVLYQGAWQANNYQGAWQIQATAHSGSISDSMTGADVLTRAADKAIAIADTMTAADAIKEDAGVGISDIMTGADLLSGVFSGELLLVDSMTGADVLTEDATVPIQDVMTGSDLLTGAGAGVITLNDQTVATDQIAVKDAHVVKADTLSGVDVLSGVLGPGILPGLANKVTTPVASRRKQPNQGTKLVTNRPSPLTSVTTSSENTTFSDTGVEDGDAWDVSDVSVGDVVVTADEHMGFVTGTGANTVNVEGWILRGVDRRGKAISKPDDAQSVTVHKRLEAGSILLCALTTNTVTMYFGFDSEVSPVTGHPLSFRSGDINNSIVLHAPAGKILNLSDVWVIAGKDQYLRWQTDSEHFPNLEPQGSEEDVGSIPLADSMTGVDLLISDAEKALADAMTSAETMTGVDKDGTMLGWIADRMTPSESLTQAADKAIADSMAGADALIEAASNGVADTMTGVDLLSGALNLIVDSMTGADALTEAAGKALSDGMSGGDVLFPDIPWFSCPLLSDYDDSDISIDTEPTNPTRGEATVTSGGPPVLFRPTRGGWDITISDDDTSKPVYLIIDTLKWIPFYSGTPFTLNEQTNFDVYVNGDLAINLARNKTWVGKYTHNGATWVSAGHQDLDCGTTCTGNLDTSPGHTVFQGPPGSPYYVPWNVVSEWYSDLNTRTIALSARYSARMGWRWYISVPDEIVVDQNPPPRDGTPSGDMGPFWNITNLEEINIQRNYVEGLPMVGANNPTEIPYHHLVPEEGDPVYYVFDAVVCRNYMMARWWEDIPSVTWDDGLVSFAPLGGASYSGKATYTQPFTAVSLYEVEGGNFRIDIGSGGCVEGQVIELQIAAYPGWVRAWVGLEALGGHGFTRVFPPYSGDYLCGTVIGYNVTGDAIPGADRVLWSYYTAPLQFEFGGGIYDPDGCWGVEPAVYNHLEGTSGTARVVFQLTDVEGELKWKVLYGEDVFFINGAQNGIVQKSW